MKLGQATREGHGSFGIPPEMHPDNVLNQKPGQKRASDEDEQEMSSPPQSTDEGFETDDEDETEGEGDVTEVAANTEPAKKTPKQILAEMGVTLTGQDWSDFIFKGCMEKRILIAEFPTNEDGKLKPFYATFRTVTGEQADLADGLLAEELKNGEMTMEGVSTRREMWNLSFAIQKLDDRPLCKDIKITDPKTKETRIDLVGTAKEKRHLLSKMAPIILQTMMSKYWIFLGQVRILMENPKSNFLAKP